MRTRTLTTSSLLALLLLAGCTSDDPVDIPTASESADAAEETSDVGVPMPPAANGYLCRYVSPSAQETLLGRQPADVTEVTTQDDSEAWVCEGRSGDERFIRVSIERGADAAQARREAAVEAQTPMGGPDHLGEAYIADRTLTALTMCKVIDSQGSQEYEPYALVSEALTDADTDVRRELTQTTTALARAMDQSIGCSPKMAQDEAAATTAP